MILSLLSLLLVVACNNEPKQNASDNSQKPSFAITKISELISADTTNVGNIVITEGVVTHVCSHSGKRCFIEDSLGLSIRVEAKGEINGFNKELMGMKIRVKGPLRVNFIDKQRIGKMEEKVNEKEEHDDCSTERKSIERMKEWMNLNNSDRYPVFYIDGEEYEVVPTE